MPVYEALGHICNLHHLTHLQHDEDDIGKGFQQHIGYAHSLIEAFGVKVLKQLAYWSTILCACLLFREIAPSLLSYIQVYCPPQYEGLLT